jgi:hypothetical protein
LLVYFLTFIRMNTLVGLENPKTLEISHGVLLQPHVPPILSECNRRASTHLRVSQMYPSFLQQTAIIFQMNDAPRKRLSTLA